MRLNTHLHGLTLPKLRNWLVLRGREMHAYSYNLRKGKPIDECPRNVLIYGASRRGTTLLEELLVNTGYFTGYHEAINTVTREVVWPLQFVRGIGRIDRSKGAVVHVKPEHLTHERKRPVNATEFLTELQIEGWVIIHAQRKNIQAQVLSIYLAEAKGAFHQYHQINEEVPSLTISPTQFVERCEKYRQLAAEEYQTLATLNRLSIEYETDLSDSIHHQKTCNYILNSLGLKPRKTSTSLKKMNNYSPESLVQNIEELRAALTAKGIEPTI